MEENDGSNIDAEYKRYLQIMRPYLGQLLNENVIQTCNAWIQRLSNCKENEKIQRNKYVFSLCYQLAKGVLDEPFTRYPPVEDLKPLYDDDVDSEESSTEVECLVIEPENVRANILYSNQRTPLSSEYISNTSPSVNNIKELSGTSCNSTSSPSKKKLFISPKQSFMCFNNTDLRNDTINDDYMNEKLEFRANNVILKLRQIKQENLMLHKELMLLKEEAKSNDEFNDTNGFKVDHSTSTYFHLQGSNTNLNSLKSKLQEVQESRNSLIESVGNLQERLDNFNELKRHEIEEIEAKHKLDIINLKSTIREETNHTCDMKIDELKQNYQDIIKNMQTKHNDEIYALKIKTNEIIGEKEKSLELKDQEISQLNICIENMKNQITKISKQIDSNDGNIHLEKEIELEKRLQKMEKLKNKNARAYEIKIANLQRDKHLNECSLQLQLINQRAQVVSEVTDENQTEITMALEKLEGKYKEIIANVQATAVQRRIHDQVALESLMKAICDIPHEGKIKDNKCFLNQQNQVYDNNTGNFYTPNKVGTIIMGNKSFAEHSAENGYFLNNEKLELFGKINIPQKDTNNEQLKKI